MTSRSEMRGNMEKDRCYFASPIGMLCIEADKEAVTKLDLQENGKQLSDCKSPVLQKAVRELSEYFAGKRKVFTVPVKPQGTDFQKRVWKALAEIPYGETRTYGQIAAATGNPGACRAVGGANNKNPILILIPCHRVIGADGSLTGFGAGLPVKEWLLKLEGIKYETV